ncbi:MAG: metallophosphatase family protein [Kiritimatiellae bacterium]|nr:metallophosphatase family protein [Kiritimatiellia bacterium]
MIWITGDKHGEFDSVEAFCRKWNTRREDVLIILGDAGINYFSDDRATEIKAFLATLPITLFCVHGNHEARPESVPGYQLQAAFGGQVYVDPHYPNQLFPVDGALYQIGSQKTLVIGGAYSVDKYFRLAHRWAWFDDEQPSDAIKARTEAALESVNWCVDTVLSHTCPKSQIPLEKVPPLNPEIPIDTSTEEWLETLRQRITCSRWYAGHFHIDYWRDQMTFLFEQFNVFDA